MTKKEQIMETAFSLFVHSGIKHVCMDDVARSLKMSKKTLYDFFSGKDDLLLESIKFNTEKFLKRFTYSMDNISVPLKAVAISSLEGFKFFRTMNDKFVDEVMKCEEVRSYFVDVRSFLAAKSLACIKKAKEEKSLKSTSSPEVMMQLFEDQIIKPRAGKTFTDNPDRYFFDVSTNVLKGFCTEKGKNEIDELRENYNLQ